MSPPDQIRAYTNALKYIDTQMTPADLVAIMAFQDGAVSVKTDFTDNKNALREVIQILIYGDDQNNDGIADHPEGTRVRAERRRVQHLQHRPSARRAADGGLDAAAAAGAEDAALLRERRAPQRLRQPGAAARDGERRAFARTSRSTRSTRAAWSRRRRSATRRRASPGGIGMFTGKLAEAAVTNFQRSQDTLYALAKDTGGKAMFDYNDLSLGIVQAAQAVSDYYIVGYYSTHTDTDGKFRRVRITLNGGQAGELAYRQGYYADKAFGRFNDADKERQLEEALMLDNPVTDITIAMEVNYFQLNRAEYFVPVAVKIPGSELELAKTARRRPDAHRLHRRGQGQLRLHDAERPRQTGHQAQRGNREPAGHAADPGRNRLHAVARQVRHQDPGARLRRPGRIGTYQAAFTVPNLMREELRLPISSVVLSSQRVPMNEALHTVQNGAAQFTHPLVYDGEKLFPSVTRVFSRTREMYVYLQAYERGAETDAAARRVRHVLPGQRQGARNSAACRDRRSRCAVKGGARATEHPAR